MTRVLSGLTYIVDSRDKVGGDKPISRKIFELLRRVLND